MVKISVDLIQKLRQSTGAKILDCKNALIETDGDVEKAQEWLRKKGIAHAAKRTECAAGEGIVAASVLGSFGVLIELNSETDFVARGQDFQNLVLNILKTAIETQSTSLEQLEKCMLNGRSLKENILEVAGKVSENIVLRKFSSLFVTPGIVASYVHSPMGPSLGKMGVLVALQSQACANDLHDIGKKIAMHIAASGPSYISCEQVPQSLIDQERRLISEQIEHASTQRKSPEVVEKMIEGKLKKFLEQIVLQEQDFIHDASLKVKKFLELESQRLGSPIHIAGIERLILGEAC